MNCLSLLWSLNVNVIYNYVEMWQVLSKWSRVTFFFFSNTSKCECKKKKTVCWNAITQMCDEQKLLIFLAFFFPDFKTVHPLYHSESIKKGHKWQQLHAAWQALTNLLPSLSIMRTYGLQHTQQTNIHVFTHTHILSEHQSSIRWRNAPHYTIWGKPS